jgi:hypothetical protein
MAIVALASNASEQTFASHHTTINDSAIDINRLTGSNPFAASEALGTLSVQRQACRFGSDMHR